jgi:hypothetical protein
MGTITGLQPIEAPTGGKITGLQPIDTPQVGQVTPRSPQLGEFMGNLFDPNYKQADPELFGSPLAGHVAQSFDIYNVAKNIKDGVMGMAHFAHDLGTDLRDNPNWVLGRHSTYEKFVGAPAEEQARQATELWGKGRKIEAAGHEMAGMLPLIGPYVAKLSAQAGTGDVGGATSQGLGAVIGGKTMEMAAKAPSEAFDLAKDFSNRANSLDAISNGASAIHAQASRHIETAVESLKAEGVRTIQDAIKADQATSKAAGVSGTIPSTPILTEGLKALEDVGYSNVPKPVQAAIARIGAGPTNMTLEEAVKLRTAFGDAAAKASGNPKSYYVLSAAREALNPAIEARFGELGQAKAWNYYNKKFTAAYDIQESFKNVLEGSGNRYESIAKMDAFSKMNLQELQREMKNQGLNDQAKQLDVVKADAKRVTEAHDTLSKKMGASMFRLALTDPKAALMGITTATLIHPVAGIGGYLLGTMLSNAMRRVQASMEVGRLGKSYPDAMQTITPSGPKQTFEFKPSSGGGPAERRATPGVAPGGVERRGPFEATEGASKTIERDPMMKAVTPRTDKFYDEARAKLGPDASNVQVASEANRMREMNKRGMPYQVSETSKADRIQRIKKANKE